MKITGIMSVYNEQDFLPLKINWCRSNNIDLYVCENISTDNTVKLLNNNEIAYHRYDTMGVFSEMLIRNEVLTSLYRLKPEWALYMGCDLFMNLPEKDIPQEYNCISLTFISMKYTGEERIKPFNPFDNFRYGMKHHRLKFLFRWSEDVKISGDNVYVPDEKCFESSGILVNYGDTKPAEQRNESMRRRELAWECGENKAFGEHFRMGNIRNWTWDKDQLIDFSQTEYWDQIQNIKKDCGL